MSVCSFYEKGQVRAGFSARRVARGRSERQTSVTVVKLVGAAYLVFLGVQALRQGRRDQPQAPAATLALPRGNPWRTGLVSNVFNPKIAVFCTGLLPTLAPARLSPHSGMALLVLVHAVLTAVWLGAYVLLLSKARSFFEKPAVRRGMDRATGAVLTGFGLRVATTQP
ncbi:LysE family translocator [Streptomyces mutabilis]|uniref:LysE family translocator n=1 Tax=Streptomyces mutabilis TaxID=67332 RepID=UPI0036CC426A